MILEVKYGRVWIPKKEQIKYKSKFIEIFIKNNNKKSSFIAIIPQDGRFYIPINIRKELKIRDNVKIEKIIILKNKRRNNKLISKNKFNILSIIPEKTLSGYEIFVKDLGYKYLCWYCAKGRPKEILLNKYVPLSFVKLLGYYQAEGRKPKLRKRRGRELNFTNKRFSLIVDFFNLTKYLFNDMEWNATIRYNKSLDFNIIKNLRRMLIKLGLDKNKISIKTAKRIKEYTIKLWISSSILAETIDKFNKKIKNLLCKNKNESLFKNYYQGYFAGDGNFFAHRDKKGSLHSRTSLFEEREDYIKEHKKILDFYGLEGNIKKHKEKNLYILTLINNWFILLNLLKYDLFFNAPHHKKRLIWVIKNHNRFRSLNYFLNLPLKFNIRKLKKITNKEVPYCYCWIRDRRDEGLIRNDEKSFWKLTNNGLKVKRLLNKVNVGLNLDSFQNNP